jgi:hypothetical protein
MGTKHFGESTHWDKTHADGNHGEAAGGWYRPGENYFIRPNDPCWNRVLQQARAAYGDPNIHYDTDNPWQERHLVFGDGTRLPADGTVVYHDAATKQNWAQNDDGTVSLVGPDGHLGPQVMPTGYRKIGDRYAPVSDRGEQIAPQLGGVPGNDNGFYADPATGMLTPKNNNGDYYTLGPGGKKSYFDKNGAPITEDEFNNASKRRDPAEQHQLGNGLSTDEQQSGKAADAVKKLQQELKTRYTRISDAEEKLSEVLLGAHATTVAGQKKLHDIQSRIVEAANNPAMAMETPAGERAFLTFLRNQVGEIDDLLASGSLSAEDQSRAAQALSALYAADAGAPTPTDAPASAPSARQPAPAPPAPDPAPSADPAAVDASLGLAPQAPDPGLSDLLGGAPMGMPMGADPLSSLASMLPALSGLGAGAGTSPLDALGGLAGAVSPLAGLASQLGDRATHDPPADTAGDAPERAKDGKDGSADPAKADTTTAPAGGQQPAGPQGQNRTTSDGQPPTAVVPAASASATVKLPDGSTATARNAAAAQAIRDYLAGDTVDASYRKNGIQLPPPGTPITHPVDPSRLSCGDLAMFKDHYVPVLSSVKAFLNGQVVPLGSVASSPDFLGWIDPTAAATAAASPPPASTTPPGGPAPAAAALPPPAPATAAACPRRCLPVSQESQHLIGISVDN